MHVSDEIPSADLIVIEHTRDMLFQSQEAQLFELTFGKELAYGPIN